MLPLAAIAAVVSLATPCTDRSVKLDLVDQLPRSPEILVLGSSRARQAEPAFLQRLTGRRGFNAAVTGGTAADAWVTTRYAADRFPRAQRHYVWFVDAGIATNGINPQLAADPRAKPYLSATGSRSSRALVKRECAERRRYRADGSLASQTSGSGASASVLAASVASRVAAIRAHPPRAGGTVDPRRYVWFERTIAFMNERGERPVIVLNPIHPEVLAELRKHGFPARATALAYLRGLQDRLDFVLVDCQDIRNWGGSPTDWSNASHVTRPNMRRMLRYVVAQSRGALEPRRSARALGRSRLR